MTTKRKRQEIGCMMLPTILLIIILGAGAFQSYLGEKTMAELRSGVKGGIGKAELGEIKGVPDYTCSFSENCVEEVQGMIQGARPPLKFNDAILYRKWIGIEIYTCAFFFDDKDRLFSIQCGDT